MVVQLAQDTDITDVQYIDCTYTHNGPNYSHYLFIYICICFGCIMYIYMLVYLAYLCTLVSGHILRLIITLKTNYFVAFRDCPWLLLFALWLLIWLLHFECVGIFVAVLRRVLWYFIEKRQWAKSKNKEKNQKYPTVCIKFYAQLFCKHYPACLYTHLDCIYHIYSQFSYSNFRFSADCFWQILKAIENWPKAGTAQQTIERFEGNSIYDGLNWKKGKQEG